MISARNNVLKVVVMSESRFLQQVRFCLFRGWLLYLLIVVAAFTLIDMKKLSSHARPSTLSRLRPDYQLMTQAVEGRLPFDRKIFEDQVVYLQNVNAVMGERADANILLAYSYYQLQEQAKARKLFIRSLELNPTSFWVHYDLAVLAFASGDLDKTVSLLGSAVQQDINLNMRFLLTSRVFLPLISEGGYSPQKFYDALRSGYSDAYKMLILIEFPRERFSDVAQHAQLGMGFASNDADRAFFLYFAGVAAMKMGDLATAGRVLEECLRIDPEHPEALASMGVLLNQAGRKELASGFIARAQLAKTKRGPGVPNLQDFKLRVF
jgi:tetratricopeptide (TPR) repeat protein